MRMTGRVQLVQLPTKEEKLKVAAKGRDSVALHTTKTTTRTEPSERKI